MHRETERRAFVVFRVVLGASLLYGSVRTLIATNVGAIAHSTHDPLVAVLAGMEAIGALLFLVPRTLRAGTVLLVVTVGTAFLLHLMRGEPRPDLLVYGAGAVLVAAQGSGPARPGPAI